MSKPDQQFLIGVDGGGTGCRAAIGTPSAGIIAQAAGGRANASSDPDLAIKNITDTITAAANTAKIDASTLKGAVVHLGLAGVMTPADSQRIAAALPYNNVTVTDDRPTAVTGALGPDDGFVLSVGTGTIVASSHQGAFKYIGGWGFQVSDQGSGAWLGRAALEQVFLCHDGLADFGDLTRTLFATFDSDPNAIVAFSLSAKPGDYAAFAPMVVDAGASGDAFAQSLMMKGADYFTSGFKALGFQSGDTLCLSGGLGPHYARYLPPASVIGRSEPRGTALDGAFQLARSSARTFQRSDP